MSETPIEAGAKKAKIASVHQALIRAFFHGNLIAFAIWGPWQWWLRVALCLVAMLVYGAVAVSTRLEKHL